MTAGALVQRFGSKQELLHAHARHAAATGDIGLGAPRTARTSSPLQALRAAAAVHARLAESPRAALRNLAYLQNDLADPVLRRHLLRLKRAARARYEQLAGRRRGVGRTARRHRRSGAGAHDRGHARWFVPGVDALSGGLRCRRVCATISTHAPAVPDASASSGPGEDDEARAVCRERGRTYRLGAPGLRRGARQRAGSRSPAGA